VLAAAVTAGLLVAPVTATAETETKTKTGTAACLAVDLPAPAGTVSAVMGGDPTGRYLVGWVRYPDGLSPVGALWQRGRYTEIDASSVPHVQMNYHDVNSHGVVVGERMTDYSSFHTDAFTYRGGKFTFLPPLRAGDSTQAVGINSRGDVVGNSFDGSHVPVLWPADRPGTVRALPVPDEHPFGGRALGIDEDGSVVGYLTPYPPGTPYLWPADGRPRPLPMPGGGDGIAVAIQGGMVAGEVVDPATGAGSVALWNLRTGRRTLFTDVRGGALSVNRDGTIGASGALLHADGRVVPLNTEAQVYAVDDNGVAAGTTDWSNGHAVRWPHC
jgi:uncharacterized membrane protein